MFVEGKAETKGRVALWLEGLARRHPGAFTAVIMLLAATVTVVLLFQTGYPFILYQGF
jgi:hypothetical protein